MGANGSSAGCEPVARMMWSASYTSVAPSMFITLTCLPGNTFPVPLMTVTLFFLNKYSTPLFIVAETPRLRATMAARSGVTFSAVKP